MSWSVERTVRADDATDSIQGFSAVHLGAIVATLWVLMLNGIVGFQLLDDGTPLSLGLILLSAAALFIGTGYIALDTAFSYSHHFDGSLTGTHRNIGLYVLYQLAPLVFLVAFFILETILVLRVLGEKKPMRRSPPRCHSFLRLILLYSVPLWCRSPVRHRTDLPVRRQHTHMSRYQWQDQRSVIRDTLHPTRSRDDMGLLEQHNGRFVADARLRRYLYLMTAAGGFLCSFDD